MKILFIFLIFLIININKFIFSLDCTFKNEKLGTIYDLSPLYKNSSYYSGNINGLNQGQIFKIYYNFCLMEGLDICKDQDSNACMEIDSITQYQVGSLKYIDHQDTDNGIVLIYNSQEFSPSGLNNCSNNGNKRTFRLTLTCGQANYLVSDGQESERCVYDFIATSKVMCSNIWVSSALSTLIQGGETSIYGYFGITSSQLKVYIGDLECINPKNISQQEIKCQVPPSNSVGFKNITIYDGDNYYSGKDLFRYTSNDQSSQCLDNCFNEKDQGECINGQCICKNDFIGINCASKSSTSSNNNQINSTTGDITINNQYLINIYSLIELDIQGIVKKEILLTNNWKVIKNSTQDNDIDIIIFNQFLNNSNFSVYNNGNHESTIEYKIEIIKEKFKDYSFAGLNFTLHQDSIKVSIIIKNYRYLNSLNTLQLRILSGIGNDNNNQDDCNKSESKINTLNNLDYSYLQITKDQKIFQGRIINKIISDDRSTFITTSIVSQNESLVLYGLNLPHFVNSCILDPDWQLLLSQDYKDSCNNSRKWFLPVVIVVPVVSLVLIIILSSIIYKNNIIKIKILKSKVFKLNNSIKNIPLEE